MIKLILSLALSASAAFADQGTKLHPEKTVARIALKGWVELQFPQDPVMHPDGGALVFTQTMALDKAGKKAYWVACTPPTGYLSFVNPITLPTSLMETEVVKKDGYIYEKKPGTQDRTVAYGFFSFSWCEYLRATSLHTSSGKPVTLVIEENTPILGPFGLRAFDLEY